MFLDWRPALRLFAETSGKNAIVITAQADRELAIKDLVKSAFGHAGQKCSAASLAILEAEVYDDPAFRRQLRDAAASLPSAPYGPGQHRHPAGPAPAPALLSALTKLDPREEWLLEPRQIGDDPCLWSPGIKLGIQPDSWFRRTECFGPVLGLIRADDLDHAIRIQNDSAFGLTAGIHSLDEAEVARWLQRVEAGNLYVNRAITGAVVQRQPFGGWKSSCIGPGAKAGGPNYLNLFTRLTNTGSNAGSALSPSLGTPGQGSGGGSLPRSHHELSAHPRSMKGTDHKQVSIVILSAAKDLFVSRQEEIPSASSGQALRKLRMTAKGRRLTFRAVPGEGTMRRRRRPTPRPKATAARRRISPARTTRPASMPSPTCCGIGRAGA